MHILYGNLNKLSHYGNLHVYKERGNNREIYAPKHYLDILVAADVVGKVKRYYAFRIFSSSY